MQMQEVVMATALVDVLDRMTEVGTLVETAEGGMVRCTACAHRCLIPPGRRGVCKVRFNQEGKLRVPWGYVAALQVDPIEKKPFNHFYPGEDALTFGMLGCDFHCDFCQNWVTSQALRDPDADHSLNYVQRITPEELTAMAKRAQARMVVSSYNEPLITTEWAVTIFEEAKRAGLKCAYVSNGNATPEALRMLQPYLTAYKIDLKCMQDRHYRSLGGVLQNILDSIRTAHDLGLWVEVVTLVIPGFNDSSEELWDAARFLASVSADIPWHVTAFHPDYKMTEPSPTPVKTLQRAAEIGQEAGLHYVYAGNIPGRVGTLEDTICPQCQEVLVHRVGYTLLEYRITSKGTCPQCGTTIPGVWTDRPSDVRLGGDGFPRWVRF